MAASGPHGSPGDAKHRPETRKDALLTMRVSNRLTARRSPGPVPIARCWRAGAAHPARPAHASPAMVIVTARVCAARFQVRICPAAPAHPIEAEAASSASAARPGYPARQPFHPAQRTPPAFRPWPVRVRLRGAARQNHRRGRPAAPAPRPSPGFARRAHRPRPGASRGRRAIDRCRPRMPPAAGSVPPADAARAGRGAHWRRGLPVRSAARTAWTASPTAA